MASSEYGRITVMPVYAHRFISRYACCRTRGHNGTRNLYICAINANGIRVQQCTGVGAEPYAGNVISERQIRREGEGPHFWSGQFLRRGSSQVLTFTPRGKSKKRKRERE